ncbi:MAG TPA: DUF4443 domain-containing protein [Nitrososphaeraceae archaeon]|nr:DUF4443 domain-containing protein [Nitrososphaeraceae archaeon]
MHTYVRTLQKVASRIAPSRILSFEMVHVLKTLQLIQEKGHVSRHTLCKKLDLGEGTVKTLVKHLKIYDLVVTDKSGTRISTKGTKLLSELVLSMPAEMSISTCSVALGKFNYGILLRQMSYVIKTGIEQRDSAIKMNALGATTLVYKDKRFIIPNTNFDALRKEQNLHTLLVQGLNPEEDDVLIIGSDNKSERIAEFAAKSAALITIMNHDKHIF